MVRLLATVLLVCILTGCTNDQRILEDLGMIQSTSYDLAENNKLRVVTSIPVSRPDAKSESGRMVLSTITDSSKSARLSFSRKTELLVVSGQLRNALFGSSLAKEGLSQHVDTLLRDPSIAFGVKVSVVNGEAGELLSKDYEQHLDTGRYIDLLLTKESLGSSVPKVTLYEFTRDYNDDGIDPIAPMIKDAGKDIEVDGIALFQKDRYVMKVPAKQAVIFSLFRGDVKQGELSLNVGKGEGKKEMVLFSSLGSKRKVKVHHMDGNRLKVDITASIQGSILEFTGEKDLSKKKNREELENRISNKLTAEADQIVKEMQRHKVDSFGVGQYVRNSLSYAEWKSMDWRKVYPEIQINCHVKVLIKSYGKYS
jgi:spore germination protein